MYAIRSYYGRCDERQAAIVEPEPVEKPRLIAKAAQRDVTLLFENQPEQALARLIAHRLVTGFLATVDGVHHQIASFRIEYRHHASTHPGLLVKRAQDFTRGMPKIQRAGKDLAHAVQRLQLDPRITSYNVCYTKLFRSRLSMTR